MFESLFGVKPDRIRKTCILTPFFTKGMTEKLGVHALAKGHPYACADGSSFTLILTRIGPAFAGDCVLHLKETPCENILFLGACGLIQRKDGLDFGSLVIPRQSLSLESFSHLIRHQVPHVPLVSRPDAGLMEKFQDAVQEQPLPVVNCASFGSFQLENDYADYLKEKDTDVVEMECSALFEAAGAVNRKALAVLYITDILGEHHPFRGLSEGEQKTLDASVARLIERTLALTRHL